MEAVAVVELVALVLKHGAPAVMDAMNAFGKPVVSSADVAALEGLVAPPETYFEKE